MFASTSAQPVLTVTHQYEIHGYGGSPLVQARLASQGQFSHISWEPGPPAWRMHYQSPLAKREVEEILRDLIRRYDLKLYEAS